MQAQPPLISVIIPHLNQLDELNFCLESLDKQTLGPNLFEVIVVDNGSETLPHPQSRNYLVKVIEEKEAGPGPARNTGALEASGEIFAFIDADCRAHPDWLNQALRLLEASPAKTLLGGDVRIWRDDPSSFSALEAYEAVFAYRFQLYIEQHGFCGTGNLMVRREDFKKIGPFKGIQFAEDIEWGKSVKAAGCKFRFAPEMIVYHPARKTLRELFRKWDRHIQHAVNVSRGQAFWLPKWLARAAALLVSPAVDWVKIVRSDRIEGVGARLSAIAVLVVNFGLTGPGR